MLRSNTLLNYHGLPGILLDNNFYIIYSPFSREFALIDKNNLNKKEMLRTLSNKGFFKKQSQGQGKTIKLGLITTTACNQKCDYCATCAEFLGDKNVNISDLSMNSDSVRLVIQNLLKRYSIGAINFMGGEPTLNMPVIKTVIELVNSKSPKTMFSIQTNGLINKKNMNYLIEKGLVFSISWDGVENDEFRSLSEIVKNNILILVKKGALFKVRMTVGKWNYRAILSSVEWLVKKGVKFIQLEPMLPEGRGSKLADQSLSPADFENIFFRALEIVEKNNCFLINYAFTNLFSPKEFFCDSAAGEKIILNPDTSVSSCYKVQRKKDSLSEHFIIGNYNSKKIRFKESDFNASLYSKCKKCPFYFLCSGACPFENLKSKQEVDPYLCELRSRLLITGIVHLYECKVKKRICALEGFHIMGRIAMKRRYDNLPNFML